MDSMVNLKPTDHEFESWPSQHLLIFFSSQNETESESLPVRVFLSEFPELSKNYQALVDFFFVISIDSLTMHFTVGAE